MATGAANVRAPVLRTSSGSANELASTTSRSPSLSTSPTARAWVGAMAIGVDVVKAPVPSPQ